LAFRDEAVDDLRRRLAAARWPSKELVPDASQGVQLEMLQALGRYWANDYDFGRVEAQLNALPQYTTEIDGLGIHFIHVRSRHEDALPLIVTHGWPGSVIEMLDIIGPLTDPTAHGGSAEDAFHLVLPSLPGYGLSDQPTELGWDPGRVASAWAQLMERLGYSRYVAQGGDQGASVTDAMARQAPEGLLGVHLNLLTAFPTGVGAALFGGLIPAGLFKRVAIAVLANRAEKKEPEALDAVAALFRRGYFVEMPEHPQTIGYALTDTPVGMAAWMLDHDPDSYAKISRAFSDGSPVGGLTRDRVLDNMTLYWLTNTATSSARLYWEQFRVIFGAITSGAKPPKLSLPVAFTVFPGEIFQAPRSWAEDVYPNLIYFNEAERGGHFAAWEEPAVFTDEIRAAFASLR
jgi:pimeloyl-ACP methyl ester carboxylesterase